MSLDTEWGSGKWPRTPQGLFPAIGPATAAALFYGLPGAPAPPTAPEPWASEVAAISREWLAALALAAATSGRVLLDDETVSSLDARRRAETAHADNVEHVTHDVLRRLSMRGVPAVITNGPMAPVDAPSDASDLVRDVHLLVPPDRFFVAFRILSAMGFVVRPDPIQPQGYFENACQEGVGLVRGDDTHIELSHHIAPWVWGQRLSFVNVQMDARERPLLDDSVRVAGTIHSLLIAVLRILSGRLERGRELRVWRDFVAAASRSSAAEVVRVSRHLGLDWMLATTLRALPVEVQPTGLLDDLGEQAPTRATAFRARHLQSARTQRSSFAQALRLPLVNSSMFVAGLLLPSPNFLEQRFGSRLAYPRWWRSAFAISRAGEADAGTDDASSARLVEGPLLRHDARDPRNPSERSMRVRGQISPIPGRRSRNATTLRERTHVARRAVRGGSALFPRLGPATMATLFHGVDGAPSGPADPYSWDDEMPVIIQQRLAGLALAAALGTGTELHAETESRLHESHLATIVTALRVESTALAVLAALGERSIPFVIVKGIGIARTYPQPSLRPYGDVDVLVPAESFGFAMRTLHSLGFEEYFESGEPRSYFSRHCREGVNLVRPDGASIDLHHRIPPWVWGERLSFTALKRTSMEVAVAGGSVPVASPVHNLMIAALQVISDRRLEPGRKLLVWRDVVTLANVCDPDRVAMESRRVDLDWYLAFIFGQLPRSLRPLELLERLGRPDPRLSDRFRLRRLIPPAIGSKHQVAQAFRLPLPNAAAFLAGYTLPSQAFLRLRYGDPWAYRAWWQEAFGRLREASTREPRRDLPWM